jgi:hypothetical protein
MGESAAADGGRAFGTVLGPCGALEPSVAFFAAARGDVVTAGKFLAARCRRDRLAVGSGALACARGPTRACAILAGTAGSVRPACVAGAAVAGEAAAEPSKRAGCAAVSGVGFGAARCE